eukprot:scaffold6249_cov395-Prasinococcus_capsulatus_cf.AAC.11
MERRWDGWDGRLKRSAASSSAGARGVRAGARPAPPKGLQGGGSATVARPARTSPGAWACGGAPGWYQ